MTKETTQLIRFERPLGGGALVQFRLTALRSDRVTEPLGAAAVTRRRPTCLPGTQRGASAPSSVSSDCFISSPPP